ncbi:MAG: S41 family peptidase [bacterium]
MNSESETNNVAHPQHPIKKIVAIFVLIAMFSIGFVTGKSNDVEARQFSGNSASTKVSDLDFSLFWKVWTLVNEKYVPTHVATSTAGIATTTVATNQDRIYGAIKGMVSAMGDPYTTFFTPEENTSFKTQIDGNFEGIGMEVGQKDGILTVIAPIAGSPSERAGIKTGDKIIKINDTISSDLSVDQAVSLIRGKKGTKVILTILREGSTKPIVYEITRDVINLPTLDANYSTSTGIYTIRLYSFNANSRDLFNKEIDKFALSGSNKLIIDLRGNPGGFLDSAVSIASNFLPGGAVVVRESYGTNKPEDVIRSEGYNTFANKKLPKIVILIDGGSASASEILAGALHEQGVATLVGTQSFGKGSVQELVQVTPDTSLKVTVARWLTPQGNSISQVGIKPDVEVKISEDDVKAQKDPQLAKAVEILTK